MRKFPPQKKKNFFFFFVKSLAMRLTSGNAADAKCRAELPMGSYSFAQPRSGRDGCLVRAHPWCAGDPFDCGGQAAHRSETRRRRCLHHAGRARRQRQSATGHALPGARSFRADGERHRRSGGRPQSQGRGIHHGAATSGPACASASCAVRKVSRSSSWSGTRNTRDAAGVASHGFRRLMAARE